MLGERYDRDLAGIFAGAGRDHRTVVGPSSRALRRRKHPQPAQAARQPDAWECVSGHCTCIGQGTRDENTEAEPVRPLPRDRPAMDGA